MKTLKYTVTSVINSDVNHFSTKKEVNQFIKSELKFANVYEKKEPYTINDFLINQNY